ncbi:MAG: type VI secretion system tip protein VgrG [Rhodospirillales bacterium]|nr:MAG: type VI secretion system tip protein VgrG [Rhodospirillales bacterium]
MAQGTRRVRQDRRWLQARTPLAQDEFILTGFTGEERVNEPFRFMLRFLSHVEHIEPERLLGADIAFSIGLTDEDLRWFHGICSRVLYGQRLSGKREEESWFEYHLEVVPQMWLLTHRVDCRIFQQKTTRDIISDVMQRGGQPTPTFQLSGPGRTWEYCVQYHESDFDFVSRLMEEEGIFYFHKHSEQRHELVIADRTSAYEPARDNEVYLRTTHAHQSRVTHWDKQHRFLPSRWAHKDYDFKVPKKDLLAQKNRRGDIRVSRAGEFEIFDWPGDYIDKGNADGKGDRIAVRRMEALEATWTVVEGRGDARSFTAGARFKLKENEVKQDDDKEWVLQHVSHAASGGSFLGGDEEGAHYSNSFTCVPKDVVLRPERKTRRPVIPGPQTAVVTGSGEIDVDEYGRIFVQFHWDRHASGQTSCRIRCAQSLAGDKFGAVFHPRVGQEVVVTFIDGDPDKPLVTGCVYNGDNKPPWDLPGNKTQSGWETRSTTGGGKANANLIRFEDKKGSEVLFIHAEKDQLREVENDDTLDVGHDQTETIKNNRETTITQGNDTLTVKTGKQKIKVAQEIVIECGDMGTRITMTPGTIKLESMKIDIVANGMMNIKAGGVMTITGAMVKIN